MPNVLRFSLEHFNGIKKGNDKFKDLMMRSCEIVDFIKVKDREYMLFHTLTTNDMGKNCDYTISITNKNSMLTKEDLIFLEENENELITACEEYAKNMRTGWFDNE